MQPNTISIGNLFNVVSALLVFIYALTALLFAKPGSRIFDSEWVEHGFCVIQKDIPYWNSHDLCLYFDVILVAIGLLIYKSLKGVPTPEMKVADEYMLFNMLGHLAHGFAHGYLATQYRDDNDNFAGAQYNSMVQKYMQAEDKEHMKMEVLKFIMVGMVFWIALLKGIVPTLKMTKLIIMSILAEIGALIVKDVLLFAYVNGVLSMAAVSTQLMLPKEEKGFIYAAFSTSSVILSIIPWIESTACQNVAAKLGGHLIFDAAIPILITGAYCASWYYYSGGRNKEKVM